MVAYIPHGSPRLVTMLFAVEHQQYKSVNYHLAAFISKNLVVKNLLYGITTDLHEHNFSSIQFTFKCSVLWHVVWSVIPCGLHCPHSLVIRPQYLWSGNLVLHSTAVEYSKVQSNVVMCSKVKCITIKAWAIQYSAVHCTALHCTALHCTVTMCNVH